MKTDSLSAWVAKYFDDYLIRQRRFSRHTLHSYRDCWKLLIAHACEQTHKPIEQLRVADMSIHVISDFLDALTVKRANVASTRNIRLAAIKSFFRWLAMTEPAFLGVCTPILTIGKALARKKEVSYLTKEELDALLAAIESRTPRGMRNYALIALMYNTGARVQEALNLRVCDVQLQRPYLVKLLGKGNRERICVLWPETAEWIRKLLEARQLPADSQQLIFVNRYGAAMTRHGVRYILREASEKASAQYPSIRDKAPHPHTIRHTAAMHMLQSGVDIVTIQSILGHSSPDTTSRYAKADLEMKQAALEKCEPLTRNEETPAWKKEPDILEFLNSL